MDHKTITEILSERLSVPKEDIGILLHSLTESIEAATSEGDIVAIPGFGSFEVRKRMERIANHPSTGKKMLYPPKLTLTFRPSTMLRKQLRDDEQMTDAE